MYIYGISLKNLITHNFYTDDSYPPEEYSKFYDEHIDEVEDLFCDHIPLSMEEYIKDIYSNYKLTTVTLCTEESVKLQWIPVKERLPEIWQSVLVWCPNRKNMYCAYYSDNGTWEIFGGSRVIREEVTAWQLLPEPPEEVEE